jgi:hypothetical protein
MKEYLLALRDGVAILLFVSVVCILAGLVW